MMDKLIDFSLSVSKASSILKLKRRRVVLINYADKYGDSGHIRFFINSALKPGFHYWRKQKRKQKGKCQHKRKRNGEDPGEYEIRRTQTKSSEPSAVFARGNLDPVFPLAEYSHVW